MEDDVDTLVRSSGDFWRFVAIFSDFLEGRSAMRTEMGLENVWGSWCGHFEAENRADRMAQNRDFQIYPLRGYAGGLRDRHARSMAA